MRAGYRLLASVQTGAKYLTPGAPTGLAGLTTHSAPRSALLYLYTHTLDTLKQFPESSVYRQSTEALTKHRLAVIEGTKPSGLEEWQSRVQSKIEGHPDAFKKVPTISGEGFNFIWKAGRAPVTSASQVSYKRNRATLEPDSDYEKLKKGIKGQSGKIDTKPFQEGPRSAKDKADLGEYLAYDPHGEAERAIQIEPEPSLTADQVVSIENQIGGGLIEEVIQVAEGELEAAKVLLENKIWEDLEDKPAAGQWEYFGRDTHTPETQAP